jgi:hypothetical protein
VSWFDIIVLACLAVALIGGFIYRQIQKASR